MDPLWTLYGTLYGTLYRPSIDPLQTLYSSSGAKIAKNEFLYQASIVPSTVPLLRLDAPLLFLYGVSNSSSMVPRGKRSFSAGLLWDALSSAL